MYTWDALQRERKPNEVFEEKCKEMFESRISAEATENLPGWDEPHAKATAWSNDMEGHAEKCVERHCEWANSKTETNCDQSQNVHTLVPDGWQN